MRSVRGRRGLAASVALLMLAALSGCASTPATGTVRGVVRFEGGAVTLPSDNAGSSPAAQCTANAQTPAELNDCVGLKTASNDVCIGSLADGSAVDAQTEVDVTDTSGTLVGLARLGAPTLSSDGSTCSYPFAAKNVPTTHAIYGVVLGPISVATLGPVSHFTKAEAFGGKAVVEIGG